MHIFAGILGSALLVIILGDAFETIILPRRVTRKFRLTRLFYRYTWLPWRKLCQGIRQRKRREAFLSFFGPVSLLMLFALWALLLILAFAILQWAFGSGLVGPSGQPANFSTDLYASASTFPTLGLGDVHPITTAAKFLMVWEAAAGFGFLAVIIGYLPVIYQAFSRREAAISLLDARAGSPPAAVEMLRRYAEGRSLVDLPVLLHQWDHWAAELLESHVSYPVLTLFRSQHANESWVGALTVIMDTCALLIVGVEGASARQAQLTFAMARHAAVDLAQVLSTPPVLPPADRLPPHELERARRLLAHYGAPLRDGPLAEAQLRELRRMYEPYVHALASYLVLDLPPWFAREGAPDNWQTSAWEHAARRIPTPETIVPDDHL
jgi:hypothetical protein